METMSRKEWNIRLTIKDELLEKLKEVMRDRDVWEATKLVVLLIEEAYEQLEPKKGE